jgi:hypothetical protein
LRHCPSIAKAIVARLAQGGGNTQRLRDDQMEGMPSMVVMMRRSANFHRETVK